MNSFSVSFFPFLRQIRGKTKVPEAGGETQSISMYYMQPLTQISLQSSDYVREVMIMCVDKAEGPAQSDFNLAKTVFRQTSE